MAAWSILSIRLPFCYAVGNRGLLRGGLRLWGFDVFLNQDVCELVAALALVFCPLVFALIDGALNDE